MTNLFSQSAASRPLVCTLLTCLAVFSFVQRAPAKVAQTNLAELVATADVIVLARDSYVTEVRGSRVAEAKVQRVLKGPADLHTLHYLADPTWACDTAEARVGEDSLLFLSELGPEDRFEIGRGQIRRLQRQSVLRISWAGRGRMPLRTVEGSTFATIWTADVHLPESLSTTPGPDPRYGFIESVRLASLIEVIEQLIELDQP